MCSLPLVHSPSSHQSWGVGRAKAGSPAHDQALPRGLQGPAVGVTTLCITWWAAAGSWNQQGIQGWNSGTWRWDVDIPSSV